MRTSIFQFLCVVFFLPAIASGRATSSLAQQHPAHAAFVEKIYQDVLGRQPSLKEEDGWIKQMADGADEKTIRDAIAHSHEARGNLATAFQSSVGRDPTATELKDWANRLSEHGNTLAKVSSHMSAHVSHFHPSKKEVAPSPGSDTSASQNNSLAPSRDAWLHCAEHLRTCLLGCQGALTCTGCEQKYHCDGIGEQASAP